MAQAATNGNQELPELPYETLIRKIFGWVVLLATTAWGLFAGTFLAYHSMQPNSWLLDMIKNHFAALMCVPMAALMAMCVVILLRYAAGPIKIKMPAGLELEGAAGPVVLWVVCFLAIVSAIKLVW